MAVTELPETGFLSGASENLRAAIERMKTEIILQPGDILFEQGAVGDALFAVLEGVLEISVLSMDGRKLSLDLMRPGELFGEIALFDPGERTATATATEPCRLWRIKNADVLVEIRRDPELAVDMIHLAGKRMRWMNLQLHEQVFLPLSTRLARKVLHLIPSDAGTDCMLALSQAELAEYVGATREAVSKTLAVWKRNGVIDAGRGGLVVLDQDALEDLAEPELI